MVVCSDRVHHWSTQSLGLYKMQERDIIEAMRENATSVPKVLVFWIDPAALELRACDLRLYKAARCPVFTGSLNPVKFVVVILLLSRLHLQLRYLR